MMELQKIKDILLGRTLAVCDIDIDKTYDYVITDIEALTDGYTIYCNSGFVGYFLTEKLMNRLLEEMTCSDESYKYSIRQTEIGRHDKKVIDWEERTWQAFLAKASQNTTSSIDQKIKWAKVYVEHYKKSLEEGEE